MKTNPFLSSFYDTYLSHISPCCANKQTNKQEENKDKCHLHHHLEEEETDDNTRRQEEEEEEEEEEEFLRGGENLREKDPMQYYSRKIDRYLDAHPWFTMVLTQCLLFLTVAIVWMIFGEKIQKVHFERVKPYLRKQVWPKVLKFSRENFAGEVAVERTRGRESDAEFRKRGGERVVIK